MKLLTIPALILLTFNLFAQSDNEMKFSQIETTDGLPSNTIQCLFQESQGMMWFGTNDGLARFDTYAITTWRQTQPAESSIGNNNIFCIFEDRDSNLYVGTERGLYAFDREDESFTAFPGRLSTAHVKSLTQDTDGRLWACTLGDGVFRIDDRTSQAVNYRHNPEDTTGLGSDYVAAILSDPAGNTWCLTSDSYLYRYDGKTDSFKRYRIHDRKSKTTMERAFSLCIDWEGQLWIGGWDQGIFRYNNESGLFSYHLAKNGRPELKGRIHKIVEKSPGILYLGSDNGLTIYNANTGDHRTIAHSTAKTYSISDNFVHDICIDKEGGTWLATYFGGVNYSNPNSTQFKHKKCTLDSSSGRIVSRFHEGADGEIYIGTDDGGVFVYDPKSDICSPIRIDKQIPNLNTHALLKTGSTLWVGTYGNGLYKVDLSTGEVWHDAYLGDHKDGRQSIYALFMDQTERLWIGTKTAIWSWTEKNGFRLVSELGYHSDIIEIYGDHKGNIWFASITKGLLMFNPKTRDLTRLEADSQGIPVPDEILSMAIHDSYIYLGTAGKGLFRYDINTGHSKWITGSSSDLSPMGIFHIIPDGNDLWLSTNKGLIRHNTINDVSRKFGSNDGLTSDRFNSNSGIRASDGRLYLGTNDGFNIFVSKNLLKNNTPPHTIITNSSIPAKYKRINLRKGHIPLTISCAVLSYMSPQENRYRYILEGLDEDWTETDWKNNQITLSDIPCGNYTFKVCGCNNDGVWGKPEAISIVVKPYWYNSVASIIFYIVFGIAVIATIVILFILSHRQRKINRAQKIKHAKEKTRIETEFHFIMNLAHEIRTPIMLIDAPLKDLMAMDNISPKVSEKIAVVHRNSQKLSALTKELLNFGSLSSSIAVSPQPIVQLTRQIAEDFTETAEANGISLRFVNSADEDTIVDINADAWSQIVNNMLTNAFKFTKDTIEISMELSGDVLKTTIYDNGTGITDDEMKKIFQTFYHDNQSALRYSHGFGLGLSIANMLAHKLGISINAESKPGEFTRFTISIPLAAQDRRKISAESYAIQQAADKEKSVEKTEDGMAAEDTPLSGRILIVDDDDDFREYLKNALPEGFDTFTASDGEDALKMLQSGIHADLIICDMIMPKINGIELGRIIKKDINLQHIPIIMLSAHLDAETKQECTKNGINRLLEKPIDLDLLNTYINNIFKDRKVLWDSFSKRPYQVLESIVEKMDGKEFMKTLCNYIIKNISNTELSIEDITREMNISRTVLFKKVREYTGMTPNNFIKETRLKKAAELIATKKYRINEICWKVGFNTPSYFSKCFYEHYGVLPKDFLQDPQGESESKE